MYIGIYWVSVWAKSTPNMLFPSSTIKLLPNTTRLGGIWEVIVTVGKALP